MVLSKHIYAMFYAVTSLLITNGLFSLKHSGIHALLDKEFKKIF